MSETKTVRKWSKWSEEEKSYLLGILQKGHRGQKAVDLFGGKYNRPLSGIVEKTKFFYAQRRISREVYMSVLALMNLSEVQKKYTDRVYVRRDKFCYLKDAIARGMVESTLKTYVREGKIKTRISPANGEKMYSITDIDTLLPHIREVRTRTEMGKWSEVELAIIAQSVTDRDTPQEMMSKLWAVRPDRKVTSVVMKMLRMSMRGDLPKATVHSMRKIMERKGFVESIQTAIVPTKDLVPVGEPQGIVPENVTVTVVDDAPVDSLRQHFEDCRKLWNLFGDKDEFLGMTLRDFVNKIFSHA